MPKLLIFPPKVIKSMLTLSGLLMLFSPLCDLYSTDMLGPRNNPAPPAIDKTVFALSSEVQRGDTLTSQTRMSGNVMTTFTLTVLSVTKKQTPETDAIMAVIEDELFEQTGVLAGMSGSPVYYQDRLIGAIAFTVSFLKKPIVGITPITAMLSIIDYQKAEDQKNKSSSLPSDTPQRKSPFSYHYANRTLDQETIKALLFPPFADFSHTPLTKNSLASTHKKNRLPASPAPTQYSNPLIPIATPLSISGPFHISPEDFKAWSGLEHVVFMPHPSIASFDLNPTSNMLDHPPLQSVSTSLAEGGTEGPQSFEDLIPGDLIGVNLVRGSMNISAFGTVTYIQGDTLLAFGHPMSLLGHTDLSLYTGYVDAVVPRLDFSYKLGRLINEVGSIRQDYAPGILGVKGKLTPRLPVNVTLSTPIGTTQLSFEIIRTRPYMEGLITSVLINSFFQYQGVGEKSALDFTLSLSTSSGNTLTIKRHLLYHDIQQNVFAISRYLSTLFGTILDNPYTETSLQEISMKLENKSDERFATLTRIDYPQKPVPAGVPFSFKVLTHDHQGKSSTETLKYTPPASLPDGPYIVTVANAPTFTQHDFRNNPSRYTSYDLESLFTLLSLTPKENELVVWMPMPVETSFKRRAAAPYPRLPTSKQGILSALPQTGSSFIKDVSQTRFTLPMPILGSINFPITIKN